MYYFEDHTADIMITVESQNLTEFFNDILAALWEIFNSKNFDEIFDGISNKNFDDNILNKNHEMEFEINFENEDELVYNFLSKYVFFIDANRFVMKEVLEVILKENIAIFKVKGMVLKKVVSYIKAPTYHNFEVDLQNYYFRGVIDV
ncbi:MAG: archease [bacterium]